MNQIFVPEKDAIVAEVLAAYDFPATLLGAVRYGQGQKNRQRVKYPYFYFQKLQCCKVFKVKFGIFCFLFEKHDF